VDDVSSRFRKNLILRKGRGGKGEEELVKANIRKEKHASRFKESQGWI
jgi:hypothetical protein